MQREVAGISGEGLVTVPTPTFDEIARVPKHDCDGILQAGTTGRIKTVLFCSEFCSECDASQWLKVTVVQRQHQWDQRLESRG